MTQRTSTCLFAVVVAAILQTACAGPLSDALQARRQNQMAQKGDDGQSDLFDTDSASDGALSLPAGSRVQRDVCYGADKQQCMDVYIPKDAKAAPILFMVHGGAWMMGDKANSRVVNNKVSHWMPRGYIIVSTNYRMSRHPDPLQQAQDVASALAYVQKNSASWGGNASRLVAMGHSAGAHLVALVASSRSLSDSAGLSRWQATVLLDGPAMDVPAIMDAKHPPFMDRVFGSDRNKWIAASPLYQLNAAPSAPMLIVCSTQRSGSCTQARAFAAKVTQVGGRAELLPLDLKHSDINGNLGSNGSYTSSVSTFLQSAGLP